ncbi:nitroreductase [Brevibacillus sp. LEMMJ03]|uniref:nitroreductase family protein n=1 Tax=Brevibacillus sp. LEMMJ03 TaxID=2595056 RepID=UPI00117F0595|nr:nitroreductase [Brevibacillus sp. LEMMJ03]TRY25873.1 nitroreductase [Brevibacillus sp. LEMMJ03]
MVKHVRAAEPTSIAKIIRERRTIRSFTNEPVTKELIIDLLNDAVWAPTHGLRQPWRFLFVSTDEKERFIEYLLQAFPNDQQDKMRTYFHAQASAFLIVIMSEDPRPKQWEEDFAASAAMIQNFQLLAWERKLGVVWKTNNHNWDPKVRQLLGVKPGEKIVGFLHLGFFDSEQIPEPKPRTPAEEKLTLFENLKP